MRLSGKSHAATPVATTRLSFLPGILDDAHGNLQRIRIFWPCRACQGKLLLERVEVASVSGSLPFRESL
jgi:hypothetical protein